MAADSPFIAVGAIVADTAWLRRLATALVRDGDGADDAVQETWLAGLTHPPAVSGAREGWLRVVLKNVVRKQARAAARRRSRERAAADAAGEAPSPEELAVRVEVQRLIAGLVVALEEPYRSTVILCYYEGQAPSEVARRLGVPAGTVRWRLSRALDSLRAQLDARYAASGRRWRALLAPLAPAVKPGWLSGVGEVLMAIKGTTKLAVAVTAAAALALAVGGLTMHAGPAGDGGSPPRPPAGETVPGGGIPVGGATGAGSADDAAAGPRKRARLRIPRFTTTPARDDTPSPADARAPAVPPRLLNADGTRSRPDVPAIKLAVRERMNEVTDRVKACLRLWETVDESLKQGVRLTLELDERGLADVWLEDRSEAPAGSLGCLSEAVYQTDWSHVTPVPVKTSYLIRYTRTDGGAP